MGHFYRSVPAVVVGIPRAEGDGCFRQKLNENGNWEVEVDLRSELMELAVMLTQTFCVKGFKALQSKLRTK